MKVFSLAILTLKRNKKEHYFIRIPKDKFYVKLIEDYGGE